MFKIIMLSSIAIITILLGSTSTVAYGFNTKSNNALDTYQHKYVEFNTKGIYKYSGKPLSVLMNKELYFVRIGCKSVISGSDQYRCEQGVIHRQVLDILYNFAIQVSFYTGRKDVSSGLNGKVVDREVIIDQYSNTMILFLELESSYVVYTSTGYMLYKDKGYSSANALYALGPGYAKNLTNVINFFKPDYVVLPYNLTVAYGGVTGKVVRMVFGQEIISPNDTTTNSTGKSKWYYRIEYENPYEKYYVMIDDIRVGFPIKIVVESTPHGLRVRYIEAFIPTYDPSIGTKNLFKKIKLTDQYLSGIVNTFVSETGVDINDPSELIIGDIYYTLYKDKQHLVPLLIVYDNRTYNMLMLYLKPDGVEVVGKAKLTGDYTPVDDTLKDYIEWIKSLRTPQAKIVLFMTSFPGIFVTIAITGIIVYLVVRLIRKWRKH